MEEKTDYSDIDELGYWLEENSDIADMYLILVRLAAGDDIKRVRSDALKWIRGGKIKHWIPAKEDYEKMKKEVRNEV